MVTAKPLVISVPARELVLVPIPSSVFDSSLLKAAVVSPELRLALDLVFAAYQNAGGPEPLHCVARPELFTHGQSLQWLNRTLGASTQHLCLSDGTSIKLIPGFRNHLFTYGLHSHKQYIDFQKLLRRAPELLGQFHSQVNSFHRIELPDLVSEPATRLMQRTAPLSAESVWFFGFYSNPNSSQDSAEQMLTWGDLEGPQLADFEKVTYIPLTEAAVHDRNFQRAVADVIVPAYFDPTCCVLIRLPTMMSEATDRMRLTLDGIRRCQSHIPQVRSGNIFFLSGDLSEDLLTPLRSRLSFILHNTFEFWRYTRALYQEATEIVLFLDSAFQGVSESAKKLFLAAFGQNPKFVLPVRAMDDEWDAD